jgi:hypothetical protein
VFSSNHTTPGLSFAAAVRCNTHKQQQSQLSSAAQACPSAVGEMSAPSPLRHSQLKVPIQSVQAPKGNNSSLNDMFKVVVTVFQRIMTELNATESEEDRIVANTKIVLKLMKQSGC